MKAPWDRDAEQALLGACLLDPGVLGREGVDPAMFFAAQHRDLAEVFGELARAGVPLDEVTIADALERRGKLKAVGGLAYIGRIATATPTAANARHYVEIVRRHHRARQLLEMASSVIDLVHQNELGQAEDVAHDMVRTAAGSGFGPSPVRLATERAARLELVRFEVPYTLAFLRDYLRGILPHDFVLLGAQTGAGKTELATTIAKEAARQGHAVYYFALEAEPNEIERRLKYQSLAEFARRFQRGPLNYPDWYRGHFEHIIGRDIERMAEEALAPVVQNLHTFYRGEDFSTSDLDRHVRSLRDRAQLIVVDHLHYVDLEDDVEEARAFRRLVKRLRNAALAAGVPVLCVAHLRKRERGRGRRLIPEMDDFHGPSELGKAVTQAIMLARATDRPSAHSWIAATYIAIPKWRQGGACPYVALVNFDRARNRYEKAYCLGRESFDGSEVELLSEEDYPAWAKHAAVARATPGRDPAAP